MTTPLAGMRFIENGPYIPRDLLVARDQGRVIFMCGAGVSKADANFPSFPELALKVCLRLGLSGSDPVVSRIKDDTQLSSMDHIFGILERKFYLADIEEAIANELRIPQEPSELNAHHTLLRLATTPDGRLQLITSNFDRLFSHCAPTRKIILPPNIPNPQQANALDGIIHLHGIVNENYDGSSDGGFIVSTASFGKAYLADGWATDFIKKMLTKYILVFVGYSAEDPPISYLLEALNSDENRHAIYAFQSGSYEESYAKWGHKGVTPITYGKDHKTLWQTFSKWAERADNSSLWYDNKLKQLAQKMPDTLQPYERGQVAHMVSTEEGVKKFSQLTPPPPAEWLCVFDCFCRFAKPHYFHMLKVPSKELPFYFFNLDSDPVPPQDIYRSEDIEKWVSSNNTWDAFKHNSADVVSKHAARDNLLRWTQRDQVPPPPQRLLYLGLWICAIAEQQTTVWWAVRQRGIHPRIFSILKRNIYDRKKSFPLDIIQHWENIFHKWQAIDNENYHEYRYYTVKNQINAKHPTQAELKRIFKTLKPYMEITPSSACLPPSKGSSPLHGGLIHLKVNYPIIADHNIMTDISIPNDLLGWAMRELRKNLEYGLDLGKNNGNYHHTVNLGSVIPEDDKHTHPNELTQWLRIFSDLFSRLVMIDKSVAISEYSLWDTNEPFFLKMKIWAFGLDEFLPIDQVKVILSLNDHDFWYSNYQKDLLISLAQRWHSLSLTDRKKIEKRILQGPKFQEKNEETERIKFHYILQRILWLNEKNCEFSFNLQEEIDRIQNIIGDINKKAILKYATHSYETYTSPVTFNTCYDELLSLPLNDVVTAAYSAESNGYHHEMPLTGLIKERPVFAFSAIRKATENGEPTKWAWERFFNYIMDGSSPHNNTLKKPKYVNLIIKRLAQFPEKVLSEILSPLCLWLSHIASVLINNSPDTLIEILERLLNIMGSQPADSTKEELLPTHQNWADNIYYKPGYNLAEAILHCLDGNIPEYEPKYLVLGRSLLSLRSNQKYYASVRFFRSIHQLNKKYPSWTQKHLLPALNSEDSYAKRAAWHGVSSSGYWPDDKLLKKIKTDLASYLRELDEDNQQCRYFTDMMIYYWKKSLNKKRKLLSSNELRDTLKCTSENIRTDMLNLLAHAVRYKKDKNIADILPEFLSSAWPREKGANTPFVVKALCRLITADDEKFPELFLIVKNLLSPVGNPGIHDIAESEILKKHPHTLLSLVEKTLANNLEYFPYELSKTLDKLKEFDEAIAENETYKHLQHLRDALPNA